MANPNIVNVSTINGVTDYYAPTGTSAVGLINNASGSNQVYKIESLVVSNVTASSANCSVTYYSGAAIAKGTTLSGGTSNPICTTVAVPANASLVVIEKSNGIYLLENATIGITSGTANALSFVISYEAIS